VAAIAFRAAGFVRDDPPATRLEKLEALLAPATLPDKDVALLVGEKGPDRVVGRPVPPTPDRAPGTALRAERGLPQNRQQRGSGSWFLRLLLLSAGPDDALRMADGGKAARVRRCQVTQLAPLGYGFELADGFLAEQHRHEGADRRHDRAPIQSPGERETTPSRRISDRMSANIFRETTTSDSWNVT
jgi:hypothetical protein